jgi:hypothetical protein
MVRRFLKNPPEGVAWDFDMQSHSGVIPRLLEADPELDMVRYSLVPGVMSEERFFGNYFFHIHQLRQELSTGPPSNEETGEGGTAESVPHAVAVGGGQAVASDEEGVLQAPFLDDELPSPEAALSAVLDLARSMGSTQHAVARDDEDLADQPLRDDEDLADQPLQDGNGSELADDDLEALIAAEIEAAATEGE